VGFAIALSRFEFAIFMPFDYLNVKLWGRLNLSEMMEGAISDVQVFSVYRILFNQPAK